MAPGGHPMEANRAMQKQLESISTQVTNLLLGFSVAHLEGGHVTPPWVNQHLNWYHGQNLKINHLCFNCP